MLFKYLLTYLLVAQTSLFGPQTESLRGRRKIVRKLKLLHKKKLSIEKRSMITSNILLGNSPFFIPTFYFSNIFTGANQFNPCFERSQGLNHTIIWTKNALACSTRGSNQRHVATAFQDASELRVPKIWHPIA